MQPSDEQEQDRNPRMPQNPRVSEVQKYLPGTGTKARNRYLGTPLPFHAAALPAEPSMVGSNS